MIFWKKNCFYSDEINLRINYFNMENFDMKWEIIYMLPHGPIIMANQLEGIIFFT
jgi:hypothetical protein